MVRKRSKSERKEERENLWQRTKRRIGGGHINNDTTSLKTLHDTSFTQDNLQAGAKCKKIERQALSWNRHEAIFMNNTYFANVFREANDGKNDISLLGNLSVEQS